MPIILEGASKQDVVDAWGFRGFVASASSTQAFNNSSGVFEFDTADVDTESAYDTVNFEYVVPASLNGERMQFQLNTRASAGLRHIAVIRKNQGLGSQIDIARMDLGDQGSPFAGPDGMHCFSPAVVVATGDAFSARWFNPGTGNWLTDSIHTFSGRVL